MWLCGFYCGAFCVESCLVLYSRLFSVLFGIVTTSLGEERELVYVVFAHLFVYFARINFCPFSLPLGVRDSLLFVNVALPGHFYLLVWLSCPIPIPLNTKNFTCY